MMNRAVRRGTKRIIPHHPKPVVNLHYVNLSKMAYSTCVATQVYHQPKYISKSLRCLHHDISYMNPPRCPECHGKHTYYDGVSSFICPDCSFEWNTNTHEDYSGIESNDQAEIEDKIIKDCNGNILINGDNIILNKDLKVKGGNNTLKKGYKMRNIKLIDGGGGHDVEAEGIMLKSQFLKKA